MKSDAGSLSDANKWEFREKLKPHKGTLCHDCSVENIRSVGKKRLIKTHEQGDKPKRLNPPRHTSRVEPQHGALYTGPPTVVKPFVDKPGDGPAALEKSGAWSTRATVGEKLNNSLPITKNKDEQR